MKSPDRVQLSALPPLSLYIHFPWCEKKCPYCDFNSHQVKSTGFDEDRYINALLLDLQTELPRVWGRKVHTIFIGGGTPSLLSVRGMNQLLSSVRSLLSLEADAEITMEANPGSVEADKLSGFADCGINRVSLGIQSFNDRHLKALGRIHSGDEAKRAIEIASRYIESINLDLMYALPEQSLDDAAADLTTALSFGTPHLSMYHLTLEPNTLFAVHPPTLPSEDISDAMFEQNLAMLDSAGYERYEVSAYCKPQRECKHNLNYWRFGDYIGIGAGAHGKISLPNEITRQVRERHPETYMQQMEIRSNALIESKTVAPNDLPFEFMLNALRLSQGVSTGSFSERTGLPLHVIAPALQAATKKGLLDENPAVLRPTALGLRYLNDLQALFYKAKKSMRIQYTVFIGLLAGIITGCGTSAYDLRAYTQSDGLVGVHTVKSAKESETQAVAEAECKKKGKRRAVFVESRATVNDRFPITNLYMCRD